MPAYPSQSILKRVLIAFATIAIASILLIYYVRFGKNGELPAKHPERGLTRLLEGNSHFAKSERLRQHSRKERMVELSTNQTPFAVVVSCPDLGIPPELIFDQGLGDLFVIQTAGNLVDSLELGSIEYAVEHLGVKLVVVLGHENCGVIKTFLKKGNERNHIAKLLDVVTTNRAEQEALTKSVDRIDNCVRANIRHVTALLQNSETLAGRVRTGELKIVGTRYDLDSGEIEIIAQN